MPPRSSLPAHIDGVTLSAMQVLPASEILRTGAMADWAMICRNLEILTDCVAEGQAPDNALRDKKAWSAAVDGCITVALECCPSAIQAAISRSDTALLSSIGQTLAHILRVTHGCVSRRPAWLRLQERPHGLQRSVEALVSVAQRPAAFSALSENIVFMGLSTAICLNDGSSRLGEGLLVDLHCAHLKVSSLSYLHDLCACMATVYIGAHVTPLPG